MIPFYIIHLSPSALACCLCCCCWLFFFLFISVCTVTAFLFWLLQYFLTTKTKCLFVCNIFQLTIHFSRCQCNSAHSRFAAVILHVLTGGYKIDVIVHVLSFIFSIKNDYIVARCVIIQSEYWTVSYKSDNCCAIKSNYTNRSCFNWEILIVNLIARDCKISLMIIVISRQTIFMCFWHTKEMTWKKKAKTTANKNDKLEKHEYPGQCDGCKTVW